MFIFSVATLIFCFDLILLVRSWASLPCSHYAGNLKNDAIMRAWVEILKVCFQILFISLKMMG